jgi:hypothetical protein
VLRLKIRLRFAEDITCWITLFLNISPDFRNGMKEMRSANIAPEVLWTPMQSSLNDPRLAHRAEPEAIEIVMAMLAGLPYAALPRHLQTPNHTRRLAVPFGERPSI